MANTSTRIILRDRVRQAADLVNSQFVSDAEINTWLDVGLAELHDILVTSFEDYFESQQAINTVAGTSDYALAADFYKEQGVDLTANGLRYVVPRFMNRERNRKQFTAGPLSDLEYRIIGLNIRLIPTPTSVNAITVYYAPTYTPLATDGTFVSQAIPQGWEELAVLHAAIQCYIKGEDDPSFLLAQKQALSQRIIASAPDRDSGEPARVVNVTRALGREIYGINGYDEWGGW